MRVVVVTGISGGGKSVALRAMEDAGWYAIDNLPIPLFDKLLELSSGAGGEIQKLALVADTRNAQHLGMLPGRIEAARQHGYDIELIFVDASDESVERRFSETRRRHPLADKATIPEAIARDRALLEPLREMASVIIDTSGMSIHELKRQIQKRVEAGGAVQMGVTVISFGYRHGLPSEADLVFDLRFLPNPFFVEGLRALTGEDEACARYVLERPETQTFLGHLTSLLGFLLPQYDQEGKAYLTIAVGCTGGQHRSVAVARRLSDWLREQGREVRLRHRDLPAKREEEAPPGKTP